VKVRKTRLLTNKPKIAIKVTGRFNNGTNGAKVFKNTPKRILIKYRG
jgi:hypothetical protein